MKKYILTYSIVLGLFVASCSSDEQSSTSSETNATPANGTGQSGVQDTISNPNVVQIAVGSKDHTTLVAAVKAASLVDALSNAGPFTVFAPTNDAFAKLPAGTVETLLKPENLDKLTDILQYHVYVGSLKTDYLQDGQSYGMVNGGNVKIGVKDNVITVNGAKIIGSVEASNGIIHVVDGVLLPPAQ